MKAVALLSGGLDSVLALKLIRNQGIEVLGIYFLVPFHKQDKLTEAQGVARDVSRKLGVQLKVVTPGEEFLKVVEEPKYGYGKNLNPCIDCKIFMLRSAKKIMQKAGAKFVVTGEVLGQRLMSQRQQTLGLIERESGLKGLLLRPLSAKLLLPTYPESVGWVNRDNLLGIQGRGRRMQLKLAKQFELNEYLQPAGGCLLTDSIFCRKLKDTLKHKEHSLNNIEMLKVGRHFRINPRLKLIVGRDEKENKRLVELARGTDSYFEPENLPGPVGISRGPIDEAHKMLAARIIARYTSLGERVKIAVRTPFGEKKEIIFVKSLDEKQLEEMMV